MKYKTLMDGHEYGEIWFSQLERTNRLDAEFYKKSSRTIVSLLKGISAEPLTALVDVSDGNHLGISDKFTDRGIPYYRGQDIHNFFIEDANPICIDEETFNTSNMRRSHLKRGDVLLSIVGTIGKVSLVSKDEKATCNCKLAVLRPRDIKKSPLIAVYLRTKYGYDQVDKFKRGAVQMGFLLEDMNQILMPAFSSDVEEVIAEAIGGVKLLTDRSNSQYADAENCLISEIGIDMSAVTNSSTAKKFFSESFGSTGRLDAEYFQEKHYEIMERINNNGTIKTLCSIYDKSFYPADREYYKYIELSNIRKSGEIDGVECILGKELPSRARRLVRKGNVIVSSVEGSLASCAIISDAYDNALCSTGFYVVDSDSYNSETLLVLLKSEPIQMLLKRGCSGTILTNITKDEFERIPLPHVSIPVQEKIKEKIAKTYSLREKGKELLECSKTALEMAVEQGEAPAIQWLKEKIAVLTRE